MYEGIVFLSRKLVRKRASNGKKKLIDEINWLLSLPEKIKIHFPEVLVSYKNNSIAYYEMPFYDIPTLRQAIFNKIIDEKTVCKILDKIFDFMYVNLYSKKIQDVPLDFVKKIHFNRFKERINQTRKKAKIFNKILQKKYIIWGKERYLNALFLINDFESNKQLINLLSPLWMSQIHGDLHFDNILIDVDKNKVLSNFVLIDPRGWLQGSDYAYDLGKLWHSIHGLYDFIHKGDFYFNMKEISDDEIKITLKYKNISVLKVYRYILENFPKVLDEKYKLSKADPNWKLRTLFNEAIHFLSLPDFHLSFDGKEEKAISLYMTGVKILNELWKDYIANYI